MPEYVPRYPEQFPRVLRRKKRYRTVGGSYPSKPLPMATVVSQLIGSGIAFPAALDSAELQDIDLPSIGSMQILNDTVPPMPGQVRPRDRFSLQVSPASSGGPASLDRSSSQLNGGNRPE